jgi:hypothetical protein
MKSRKKHPAAIAASGRLKLTFIYIGAHVPRGCQIFLGTKYQNGENYTKWPQNIPNDH